MTAGSGHAETPAEGTDDAVVRLGADEPQR